MAGFLSLHKGKATESLLSPTQPAVYILSHLTEIPVRVVPPPPKKSKDNQGAPCPHNLMVDIFFQPRLFGLIVL